MEPVPQYLIAYNDSLDPKPTNLVDIPNNIYEQVTTQSGVPNIMQMYEIILYMKDYITTNVTILPVSSVDYVTNLDERYAAMMQIFANGLARYNIRKNGIFVPPASLSNVYAAIGANISYYRQQTNVFVHVLQTNNFPGPDPLPNIEANH